MDFRLKVFISFARNLSFTNASKELQISQPAITKHIQELEAYYGVKLFTRKGGKVALSKEGELMLEHARAIIDSYTLVKEELTLGALSLSGEVRIGVTGKLLPRVAGSLLPAFADRFPGVGLNILSGSGEYVENALLEGRVELAFVKAPLQEGMQYDISVAHLGYGVIATQPGKESELSAALVSVARLLCGKI